MPKEREIIRWITVKGKHFPVYKDGSVGWQSGQEQEPKKKSLNPGSTLSFTKLGPDEYDPAYGEKWESQGFTIVKRKAKNGTVSFYVTDVQDPNHHETVAFLRKSPYDTRKSDDDYFNEAVLKAQEAHDAQTRQLKALNNSDNSKKDLQSRLMEAEFGDTFGKPSSVSVNKRADKLKDLMNNGSINPHYNDTDARKKGYRTNCALCTMSTVMQMKGYNVEAGTQVKNDFIACYNTFVPDLTNADNFIMSGGTSAFSLHEKGIANNIKKSMKSQGITDANKINDTINQVTSNINKMPRGAKACSALINDTVSKWGDGAFGEMCVAWKTGSSHSLFIFNNKGTVEVYDMQCGEKSVGLPGLESILSEARANTTEVIRYDNFVGFEGNVKDKVSKAIVKKGGN